MPSILCHLHPRPRRGFSRTVQPLPRDCFKQGQQPTLEYTKFTNEIRCAERKLHARGYGVKWLGAGYGEQEEFGRRWDNRHARMESEESQGEWAGYGEGEAPEDRSHGGGIG